MSKLLNFFLFFAIVGFITFLTPFISEWVGMVILTGVGFLILFVLMSFIL